MILVAELVRALAWTGDRAVPSRVRIPLRKLRIGTSIGNSIYPALPVSFGGDTIVVLVRYLIPTIFIDT